VAFRRNDPLLQPVHHRARIRDRGTLLVRPAAHTRRPLHSRRRARPRDARRARRQCRHALHRRVRAWLVPRRARRCAGNAGAHDHPRHGHRDHRRGVRGGRDRRARLVLGGGPRRADLRPGTRVRDPVLPAVLHLRGVRAHGRGADYPAVGPARAAAQMMRRIPWAVVVLAAAFFVPLLGSRYSTFLANDIAIWALFATSLNLLVGYTGLVSFGHAAYFGIGAYTAGILMKKLGVSFLIALPAAGLLAALLAAVFGFFCVRLTRIYFAMLTLAFAQIVWAICFKWNEVTGGEQGMPEIPYPDFAWLEAIGKVIPFVGGYRTSEYFYFLTLLLVGVCFWLLRRIVGSPFGRI